MPGQKKISRDTYLKALGLMTLGNGYSRKADECREALEALLEVENDGLGSHFADELYSSGPANLDEALRRSDYVVEG